MIARTFSLASIGILLVGCSQSQPAPLPKPAGSASGTATAPNGAAESPAPPGSTDNAPKTAPVKTEAPTEPAKTAANSAPASPTPVPNAATNVQDLIVKARQAAASAATGQSSDLAKAIGFLEEASAQEPKNRQVLALLMELTQAHGIALATTGDEKAAYPMMLRSGQYLRKLRDAGGALTGKEKQLEPLVLYNEACGYARGGEPEKAVASLAEAVDAGFNDSAQVDSDPDLASLRARDDFKKVRERLAAKGLGQP
jgi:hypothetical protein